MSPIRKLLLLPKLFSSRGSQILSIARSQSIRVNPKPIHAPRFFFSTSILKLQWRSPTSQAYSQLEVEEERTIERQVRRRRITAKLVNGSIIAFCVGIFAWHWTMEQDARKGSKKAIAHLEWFDKHMVMSGNNINEGRWYTHLTCTFTHMTPLHLGANMMALAGFGEMAIILFGVPQFALLWIGAGMLGSYAQLKYIKPPLDVKCIGASGSISGLIAALACVMPGLPVSMLIVPMNLGIAAVGEAVFSVAALREGWLPGVGHTAHLGGLAFGALWWVVALRRRPTMVIRGH